MPGIPKRPGDPPIPVPPPTCWGLGRGGGGAALAGAGAVSAGRFAAAAAARSFIACRRAFRSAAASIDPKSASQRQRSPDQAVSLFQMTPFFLRDLRSRSAIKRKNVVCRHGRTPYGTLLETARSVWFSCTSLCGGKFPPFKDFFWGGVDQTGS